MRISNRVKAILLIILVLIIDQAVKYQIKTSMTIGESIAVLGNWFQIRFIENPGMAFGLDIPGRWGKPVLTIFRIIAVIAIGWYLNQLINKKANTGLIMCIALILAGAAGNIIDSVFYGMLFSESTYFNVATMFPEGGGYAPILYGKVVDMLYFPVIQGHFPSWFPHKGGQEFIFFRPIFNLADTSISVGIMVILVWQKRFFGHASTSSPTASAGSATDGSTGSPTVGSTGSPTVDSTGSATGEQELNTEQGKPNIE